MDTAQIEPSRGTTSASTQIAQFSKHGYLFGHKLAASLSPFLHNTIYASLGLNWAQIRLDSSDIPGFLDLAQHPDFYGASVTMPNKVAIMPHLDHLTDACAKVGACNTVFLRNDPASSRRILCGTNTDVVGVRDAFFKNDFDPAIWEGRPALVIGGGGAARSAVYALRTWFNVTSIYLLNRDNAEVEAVMTDAVSKEFGQELVHVRDVEQAAALDAPGAVVSCVPDFPPVTEAEVRTRRVLDTFLRKEKKGVLLEMCYNPSPYTHIGATAEKEGWKVILGTEAMIWQGLEQDTYWTGKDASELPVTLVKNAVADKLAQARPHS